MRASGGGGASARMARSPIQPLRKQPVAMAPAAPPTSPTATVMILVVVVAALHFGRDVLIPLALSILLSFALAPLATRLRRLGLGRVPSVIAVVLLVTALVVGFGALVAHQVVQLAENLPRYEYNLRSKIRALGEAAPGGGLIERASNLVRDVGKEIEEAAEGANKPAGGAAPTIAAAAPDDGDEEPEPIPVEVHEPEPGPIAVLWEFAGPLIAPLATAGVVIVFVIFVLLQREDLRDRLIRLFGSGDVHRTTEAMNDAAERISRYLLMQLVINVLYGIPVGVGLYFIGVPNPILWGLLATILRFIPYVGPVVAAVAPIALSFAVDPGWILPLLTVALFVTLELFSNNVLEPWLYGSSTGLSPVAILVAAVFWTTLWGPVGLLLSTPLTVCLAVLGRHIPQLRFFDVMLGSEPVLEPEVKFYQRLLAEDPEEAIELAEELLEERPLDEVYGSVIVPALAFVEQDRLRGVLDRARQIELAEETREIVDQLAADAEPETDETETPGEEEPGGREEPAPSLPGRRAVILSVGARNSLDETAAAMLAHLLARRGLEARLVSYQAVGLDAVARLERDGVALICLSYVNPRALQHARRLIRRLRQRFPDGGVPVVLGLWNAEPPPQEPDVLAATGADLLVTSLPEAVGRIRDALRPPADAAAPTPAAAKAAAPPTTPPAAA